MRKLTLFFETNKGKRVKNVIIGCGASVVLLGALFKLQHWPGAGTMLIIGMSVEAFIFALQGILPPHKDYYWEKIYPDLDISPEVEEGYTEGEGHKPKTVVQQLDEMLQEANVESELIARLGKNLERLSSNIESMKDLSDAASATADYTENTRKASTELDKMAKAYAEATQSVQGLASATADTQTYHEQVQQLSKNLATLNSMYELELQDTNNYIKAMNKFYGNLAQAMSALEESVEDAQVYKEEISKLSRNLKQLNAIYGNMLSAMTMNKPA